MQFRMAPQQCAECGREVVGQGIAADGPSYHPHCSARRQAEALWRREVLASLGRIEALLQRLHATQKPTDDASDFGKAPRLASARA
jgi:hypothetical protein